MRLTCESVDLGKKMPCTLWMGLILSFEGLNRIKGCVRENSLSLPHCLPARTQVFSCLWTQTGTNPPAPLGLYPACQLQILGFLSLHNSMIQFLMINLSTYRYRYKFRYKYRNRCRQIYRYLLFLWRTQTNTLPQGYFGVKLANILAHHEASINIISHWTFSILIL